jgi:hypothetical protein
MPFRDAYDAVKANLAALDTMDAAEAVAAKTHEGTTAGLDLAGLQCRVDSAHAFARERRRRYDLAVSDLIGASYPGLISGA